MSTLKTSKVQHPSAVDPAIELDAAGKLWLAGGKVLQVVRATDTTSRTTTSTSFVDVTGLSVTITPQRSTSAILLMVAGRFGANGVYSEWQITDSANVGVSGAEILAFGNNTVTNFRLFSVMVAYATPGTTAATTYKARFRTQNATYAATMQNDAATGQIYAIEVSA